MKKKPGKYLKFYYKCMKTGRMKTRIPKKYRGYGGLCFCLDDVLLSLFKPENDGGYWAYDGRNLFEGNQHDLYDIKYKFTPLRQTIVLLMAAMNNEL